MRVRVLHRLRPLAAVVRLTHPFPSLLDAGATLSIAILAGGASTTAVRLAASMACLQASIGSLNDLCDVDVDRGRKPGKPLASGSVRRPVARAIAGAGLLGGLALSAPSGPWTLAVALLGVACGYAYDLRLSRTVWSWVPLAVALPLLPIHAWLGATGTVPAALPAVLPIGLLAGGGLALGNGLVDVERDADAGVDNAVVRLGRSRAWWIHVAALAGAVSLAVVLLPIGAGPAVRWGMGAGTLALAAGIVLIRVDTASVRERGWEAEAVGVVALGAGWLGGIAGH